MADGDDQGEADAARDAFERLQNEVALLRIDLNRHTTQLAQPREVSELPDYSETLRAIMKEVRAIAASPTLATSHMQVAAAIANEVAAARRDGEEALTASRKALDRATGELQGMTATARTARVQAWLMGSAVLAGAIAWGIFGGAVLRLAPDSWRWPEKEAARMLDMSIGEAGLHLTETVFPGSWASISTGRQIVQANQQAISACQKAAEKAGKHVSCALKVPAAENLEDDS